MDKAQLNQFTLEEKARIVVGASFFGTVDMPQKGIKRALFLDGGTGLNFEQLFGDFCTQDPEMRKYFGTHTLQNVIEYYHTPEKLSEDEMELYEWIRQRLAKQCKTDVFSPTCFPAGILMGATWNPESVYQVAAALGKEAAAYGVTHLLGTPYVNLMRDPLSGRLFEGYGEDPYHCAVLAPNAVRGVQDQGVAADVKHFAANNQETYRCGIDEQISERALYELYLPAFKTCVEAGVATVMAAYNKINGTMCTEHEWLLDDVLREEWGFDGLVLSDWGAVQNLPRAIHAGTNLTMPGLCDIEPILEAISNGTLTMDKLDESVMRVLEFVDRWHDSTNTVNETSKQITDSSTQAAYDAAVEGTILMKNENAVFPLQGKVALYCSDGAELLTCGTGSAGIHTDKKANLYQELLKIKGDKYVILNQYEDDVDTILVVAKRVGMEGNDRESLDLPEEEMELLMQAMELAKAHHKKIGVVLNVCGPIDMRSFNDQVDGIMCIFLPGSEGARACADLLCGKQNPSGRLAVTFPVKYEDTPTSLYFPGDGYHTIYGEDIYVGYRYYDTKQVETMYPFGHGLSYTTFVYSNMKVCGDRNGNSFADKLTVDVDVTNTGSMAGKEVVMLFISDKVSTLRKPKKELKRFEKVYLAPGETKTVSFELTRQDFASYDTDLHRFEAQEGKYDIIIGRSVDDIRMMETVQGEWKSAYSYGLSTPIKYLYEREDGKQILFDTYEKYGLDVGALYSNYQYTPHITIGDIARDSARDQYAEVARELETRLSGLTND